MLDENFSSVSPILQFEEGSNGLDIFFPPASEISGRWVWVLKMENVETSNLEENDICI